MAATTVVTDIMMTARRVNLMTASIVDMVSMAVVPEVVMVSGVVVVTGMILVPMVDVVVDPVVVVVVIMAAVVFGMVSSMVLAVVFSVVGLAGRVFVLGGGVVVLAGRMVIVIDVMMFMMIIDNQAKRSLFGSSVAFLEQAVEVVVLVDAFGTHAFPVDPGPKLCGEKPLCEHVVGDMGELRVCVVKGLELDALSYAVAATVVAEEVVVEPQRGRDVADNKLHRGLRASTNTIFEQLLDRGTRFDLDAILALPEGHRAIFGLDKTLAKDVVEYIFKIVELVSLRVKLNELSGGGVVDTRRLVVC